MSKEQLVIADLNRRRRALGHGLGVLRMRRDLCAAAALVPLREEKLPEWVPPFAQGFVRKVWRLSRKA